MEENKPFPATTGLPLLKENLDLELSSSKTKLQPVDKGIKFLGYFVKPDYILVRQRVVKRMKNKLYEISKNAEETKDLNPHTKFNKIKLCFMSMF